MKKKNLYEDPVLKLKKKKKKRQHDESPLTPCFSMPFKDHILCPHLQMTQRLDMYAKELAEAVKHDYQPAVVKEK